jgi:hypothetical protein
MARIAFYSDLHGTRFLLALAELVWAVTLFMPGNTFDRPTYTVMSHTMPENMWAFIFMMTASFQLSILLRGDYHSRFSTYFAAWNTALWWYVVVSMYMSVSPPPAAISGELALAFGAGWVWIRSGLKLHGIRATDYGQ